MRRLRIRLAPGREFLVAAVLFLACLYIAVFLIVTGALDAAGCFLPPTFGFGWACIAFGGSLDMRPHGEQGAKGLDR